MESQSIPTTDASGSSPCPAQSPESQAPSQIQASPSPRVTKPHWATGDPFFDTMAGMDDSAEYRQYLSQISSSIASGAQEQAALQSQIAGLSLDPTQAGEGASSSPSSTAAALANGSVAAANTGLDHWNRTREAWTKGRWQVVPSEHSNNPALLALNNPGNYDAIYDSLVYDRKRLSKPIPLPLVVSVFFSSVVLCLCVFFFCFLDLTEGKVDSHSQPRAFF